MEETAIFHWEGELSCSCTEDSIGCTTLPSDPSHASPTHFSPSIQSMMESRSRFGANLEAEIAASNSGPGSATVSLGVFRSLQEQYGGHKGFFHDWRAGLVALGDKIAEGAQGEIFKLSCLRPEDVQLDNKAVLKVFNEGSNLQYLHKQWPHGIFL